MNTQPATTRDPDLPQRILALDDAELPVFLDIVRPQSLEAGDVLLEENLQDRCMYLVTTGELAVVKQAGQGDEQVLSLLHPGDITGAMGCLDGQVHCATLRATEHSDVLRITKDRFEELVDTHPQIVFKVMRAILRTLHGVVNRMNIHQVDFTNYITKVHGRY